MKNIFFIILTIFTTTFNAQTVSLETMAQCYSNPQTCPDNPEYVKDVNGLLDKYIGTWKGTLDGKTYEFNFIKKQNVGETGKTKWDILIGRLKITNANGVEEFNNFNKSDDDANLGYNFQPNLNTYLVWFSGNKIGCNDSGYLYLRKPDTSTKLKIDFYQMADIITEDCSNVKTTIPSNKIINLTKQ